MTILMVWKSLTVLLQASTVKGKGKTEALRVEREAQDGDENEDWYFSDDVGSSNSGYYVLQVSECFIFKL